LELKNDPISSKKSKTAKMSKLLKPQTPQTRGNPGKIAQQYQNKGKYHGWPISNNPKMTTLTGHKTSRNPELWRGYRDSARLLGELCTQKIEGPSGEKNCSEIEK